MPRQNERRQERSLQWTSRLPRLVQALERLLAYKIQAEVETVKRQIRQRRISQDDSPEGVAASAPQSKRKSAAKVHILAKAMSTDAGAQRTCFSSDIKQPVIPSVEQIAILQILQGFRRPTWQIPVLFCACALKESWILQCFPNTISCYRLSLMGI